MGYACLGVAVDGGTEAGLLEAGVALDPPELRLLRHAAPARRHAFLWLRVRGTRQEIEVRIHRAKLWPRAVTKKKGFCVYTPILSDNGDFAPIFLTW